MIDMGPITHNTILGLKVIYNRAQGFIQIFQQRYFQSMLLKLKMESCHLVSTPLEPNTKLSKANCLTTSQEEEKCNMFLIKPLLGPSCTFPYTLNLTYLIPQV